MTGLQYKVVDLKRLPYEALIYLIEVFFHAIVRGGSCEGGIGKPLVLRRGPLGKESPLDRSSKLGLV